MPNTKIINQNGQIECALCKLVIGEVEKLIGENRTEEAIIHALEIVCDPLPSSIRPMCKKFVEIYTPIIIKKLLDYETPTKFCEFIQLCSTRQEFLNDLACTFCTTIEGYLRTHLRLNATTPEINTALDHSCDIYPPVQKSSCLNFMNANRAKFVAYILRTGTAVGMCKSLRICPTSYQSDLECAICQAMASALEYLLQEKYTEEEIEKALDKVCYLLPVMIQGTCVSMVKDYIPQIIEYIVHYKTTKELCHYVKLC
jgi:saposin